ncbi:MAG: sugar transferase [Acidimicrobiales bacterium]
MAHGVRHRWTYLLVADVAGLVASATLALFILTRLSTDPGNTPSLLWENLGMEVVLFLPASLLALTTYGLYRKVNRRLSSSALGDLKDMVHALAGGSFLALAVDAAVHRLTGISLLTTAQLLTPAVIGVVTVPGARVLFGRIANSQESHAVRVVIVGTGTVARRVARYLGGESGVRVVGFVDDDPVGEQGWLGRLDQLAELCDQYHVDRVLVGFSRTHPEETVTLLRALHGRVPISIVPRYFELLTWRSQVEDIYGLPMIDVAPPYLGAGAAWLKRAFDLVGASLGLLVALPVLVISAIAIKVSSPGPVIFHQTRVGRRGQEFRIAKLRTMRVGAEGERGALGDQNEVDGPLFKIHHDPRVTRVGRVLRRTSLDELPQLVNVLLGHMSLVGPRPFVVEESAKMDGWAGRRFEVRPGLTGMWQVSGRNDLTYDELCRLDYLYVASWSLWWDLRILWQTPQRVLRRLGAY